MKNKNLVSIIIPIYNVEKYIGDCLKSILAQTYTNIEIICIDDGSTDKSYNVVKSELKNSSVKYVIKKCDNQGVSVARNLGIRLATGKYVCFVDSDDMIDGNYILHMVNALEEHPDCECAICEKRNISDEEKKTFLSYYKEQISEEKIYVKESGEVLKEMLYHQISAGIWDLMIKKDFILRNELYFEEGFAYSEDLQLVWKIVACAKNIIIVDEKLYLYRQRNSSAMSKFDDRRLDGMILFQRLEQYFYDNRKDFFDEFTRFGVAYWTWSTLWQAVKLTNKYSDFNRTASLLRYRKYFPKLYKYPDRRVSLSSRIAMISLRGYYALIKMYLSLHN